MAIRPPINQQKTNPSHIGFLLAPNFALVPYSSAIETLRIANQVANQNLYTWENISINGESVSAKCGLTVFPEHSASECKTFSALFVCGGIKIRQAWSSKLSIWLNLLASKGVPLGSLSTGTYLLARSGLLDGFRCTIHWEYLAAMREEYPRLSLSSNIYEIDRNRYTCAGGTTALDMMLHFIALEHGEELAANVSDILLHDRIREMSDPQRIPLFHKIGTSQPKLTEVARLMESNLEETLNLSELAYYVDLSSRQLERLFKSHLNCAPMKYYLDLRLKNARRLLKHTEITVLDISISCGFRSVSHFCNCYRRRFGLTPKGDRGSSQKTYPDISMPPSEPAPIEF